jgi:hypothetical protein
MQLNRPLELPQHAVTEPKIAQAMCLTQPVTGLPIDVQLLLI